jgi:hypothetical protein
MEWAVLLLAAAITKMIATHREDVEYARQGQDSPRYKLKMAKLAAAQRQGKAASAPSRLGAKGYFRELWNDAWDDANDYRKRIRADKETNPRMTQREQLAKIRDWSKQTLNRRKDGQPVDDMLDVAEVRGDSPIIPDAPEVEAPPVPVPNDRDQVSADGPTMELPPRVPDPIDIRTQPRPDTRTTSPLLPSRPARAAAPGSRRWLAEEIAKGTDNQQPGDPIPAPSVQVDTGGDTAAREAADTRPLANVIPLFPSTKEIAMANSEATGLPTAIAYAEAAAHAHESFATGGSEGYTNALAGFEVSGDALNSASEAQEASTTAAAKWKEHAEIMKTQLTGREFYQANPDAGNKQFMTNE